MKAPVAAAVAILLALASLTASGMQAALPAGPLVIRDFTLQFNPAGTFALAGAGWPSMAGTWAASGSEVTLQMPGGPQGCTGPGRYSFAVAGARVSFTVIADDCEARRMILNNSAWLPPGVEAPRAERRIVRTAGTATTALPGPVVRPGAWPSFRGSEATGVADGQNLPDAWNPATGANILWRTPIAGLAHSSPIVWGDLVFVTSALSGKGVATFKPGLYGDGDASDDRSAHRWVLSAVDKRSGKIRWERTAAEGAKLAADETNIGEIDVAINHVGDNVSHQVTPQHVGSDQQD